LLENGSANKSIARQWPSNRHMIAATVMYATEEELLKAMFSVWSKPRLYNEKQLLLSRQFCRLVSD
jgi:hypothetical protein